MAEKKSQAEQLKEKLFYVKKHATLVMSEQEEKKADKYCEGYKKFLDAGKTEREAAATAVAMAEKAGFKPFDKKAQYKAGDKIYVLNREKAVILAVIGKSNISNGVNLTAAHIDSPRLDLKQNPLYESDELGYFKTHYYGGIRKYQWVTVPLAMHGVIIKKNGEMVKVCVGENAGDPVFCVTDLLPHLGAKQNERKLSEGIKGEELNIVIGSLPFVDESEEEGVKDAVKLNALALLNEMYGITEHDFMRAEIEFVPATKAQDVGLDRSMIGAYGQDDRVCAYAELRAILDLEGAPERTAVCILADKEETGSDGVSGMQSQAFEAFMADLCEQQDVALRHCFAKSFCLSADVCAAYDPSFPEVSAKRTEAKLNYGMGICKFTGARGKSGTSDASAELVAYLRRLFADNGVVWQLSEMGKVDQGGGGTIAKFMADRNIDTIDAGVPVLSMHAPFELVSKFDCWMTYRGVLAAYCDTQA